MCPVGSSDIWGGGHGVPKGRAGARPGSRGPWSGHPLSHSHLRPEIRAGMTDQKGPGLTGTVHRPPAPSSHSGLREARLRCGRNLTDGEIGGEEARRAVYDGLFHFPLSGALGRFSDNNSSRASDLSPGLCAFSGAGSVQRGGPSPGRPAHRPPPCPADCCGDRQTP